MTTFEFILKFVLTDDLVDAELYLDRLYEAGCDDALVGIGTKGRISLDFTREGADAETVVLSAINDVMEAIPDATFLEVSPDLVGVTQIADMIGYTRQNVLKLSAAHIDSFPVPHHEDKSYTLYNAHDVLKWWDIYKNDSACIEQSFKDLTLANKKINALNTLGELYRPNQVQLLQAIEGLNALTSFVITLTDRDIVSQDQAYFEASSNIETKELLGSKPLEVELQTKIGAFGFGYG